MNIWHASRSCAVVFGIVCLTLGRRVWHCAGASAVCVCVRCVRVFVCIRGRGLLHGELAVPRDAPGFPGMPRRRLMPICSFRQIIAPAVRF